MNERIAQLRAQLEKLLAERSDRERWVLLVAAVAIVVLVVRSLFVTPLQEAAERTTKQADQIESQLQLAARMAPQLKRLEGEIEQVSGRIRSGRDNDLLSVLQGLASRAQISDRLERINPQPPSRNERFPESKVEVQLRSVTLEQAVQFLYSIESAPLYLIVRSVNITARKDGSNLLDVNFKVSSFQRA